ncbi:MAG: aspartate--tRNA(Asn) ligase [Nitrososphaerales archaeon]
MHKEPSVKVGFGSLRTHVASQLTEDLVGQNVRVAGWIEDIRPLGSIAFITVRDVSGVAQLLLRRELGKLYDEALQTPRQSVISASGVVQKSRAKAVKVEVEVREFKVLSYATHPLPIDPTGRTPSALDLRISSRALDLRNPTVAAIFKIRHTVLQSIRRTLINEGFIEVNTPKIIGQAAEGGATLFTLDYFGRQAYLAQSPQLYKEQLTLALEKVFEISVFFRAEKSNTRRHLSEFISVDIEAAYYDMEDVMGVCERMVANCIDSVLEYNKDELNTLKHTIEKPTLPFPRITYRDAVRELQKVVFKIEEGEDLTDSALKALGELHKGFYFITEWPPQLKPFYIDTEADISKSFDLQFGALELASGGRRISNRRKLEDRMIELGLDPSSFSEHLKVFDWGMPPHSGWGFGLDRFMMILTGKENIREVVLYPRDTVTLTP